MAIITKRKRWMLNIDVAVELYTEDGADEDQARDEAYDLIESAIAAAVATPGALISAQPVETIWGPEEVEDDGTTPTATDAAAGGGR